MSHEIADRLDAKCLGEDLGSSIPYDVGNSALKVCHVEILSCSRPLEAHATRGLAQG